MVLRPARKPMGFLPVLAISRLEANVATLTLVPGPHAYQLLFLFPGEAGISDEGGHNKLLSERICFDNPAKNVIIYKAKDVPYFLNKCYF